MSHRIAVDVHARDPLSHAGLVSQLRSRPELELVPPGGPTTPAVDLVVTDTADEPTLRTVRALRRAGSGRVVLVVTALDDQVLLACVEAGACGFVRRSDATAARLVAVVRAAAAGDGSVPPHLLTRLLDRTGGAPAGPALELTDRELRVLRLLADGLSTREVARQLSYSERTIKNAVHELTTRLQLRNRTHAVAHALRLGLL